MKDVLFVLGASDPEMHAIEQLLSTVGAPFIAATVAGKRVYPANAYRAALPPQATELLGRGGKVYLVECEAPTPPGCTRIDHHRPGHPGYGQPPSKYWEASSIGQTVHILRTELEVEVPVTPEMRMTAAADHCLGAAYRGDCPDIDPAALLRWHVAARAAYERRPVAALMRDMETTRTALRGAPRVLLAGDNYSSDVRGIQVPELLLAAASEGLCCLSAVTARDGRTKIGCLVGSPSQISAFMRQWAPAQHLVDIYGDPQRGFAGAYLPAAGSS